MSTSGILSVAIETTVIIIKNQYLIYSTNILTIIELVIKYLTIELKIKISMNRYFPKSTP